MEYEITKLTWEAFRDRVPGETDRVLLPVGTLEAHGGIGLGTDIIIPTAMARDLAPRLNALIAPAVPYGVTNSLLPYPGSTTVRPETFAAYLYEAAAGLVRAGFRRVVVLNGHGGQTSWVHETVGRLYNETGAFAVAVEWWGVAAAPREEIYGTDVVGGHAGLEETAMVLAVEPEAVDAERARTIRRFPITPGFKARPFPASVILERAETAGEGEPVVDAEKATRFYGRVLDEVERVLLRVFEGWDELAPGPGGSPAG